jgi:acyl-CoA thioester hydrolase
MNGAEDAPTLTGTVAWSDTDASGRFHFTAALRWVENAEHGLYRATLPRVDIGRFPRRAVQATFERPLEAGDMYAVHLAVDRLGMSSVTWRWRVTSRGDTCVAGTHTAVHVDEAGRPAALPEPLLTALSSLGTPTVR